MCSVTDHNGNKYFHFLASSDSPVNILTYQQLHESYCLFSTLGATRLTRLLQDTSAPPPPRLHMSFNLSSVRSFTSSNHCLAGLPLYMFPSTLPCRMVFARVPFALTTRGSMIHRHTTRFFFFFRVLHTMFSHLQAHAFALSVIVARSSAVHASSSRRQERRWAIVCGSPQSQSTDWASFLHGQPLCAVG